MVRHPEPLPPETGTSMWSPAQPDPDLEDAAENDPATASWLTALDSQSRATMRDHQEELLYSQAPDALRQAGIEPTETAVGDWVQERLEKH